MTRLFTHLVAVSLVLSTLGSAQLTAEENRSSASWSVQAQYTDTCSCDATCPCFFGSAPTHEHCEGLTLVEIEKGHHNGVRLDGVDILAVYRGGAWMKFYVSDEADETQTQAAVRLLPAFEDFFVSDNVLEIASVPITVERTADRIAISAPNTTAELEVMRGKNGQPIRIENLPSPSFPTLPMSDHTQYRSVLLKHTAADEPFEFSGTTGFTARIDAAAPDER